MDELAQEIRAAAQRLAEARGFLRVEQRQAELAELERRMAGPGFWDDPLEAGKVAKQAAELRDLVAGCDAAAALLEEAEVALELALDSADESLAEESLGSIVGSGPASANPHAVPGDRVLAAGDLVVLDFGAKLDDYRSDMTRTVSIGRPSERQREVYDCVLAAQLAALEMVGPGVACTAPVDKVNEIFAAGGFEPIPHGLGHGVGIDIHESPVLAGGATGSLEPGHVVTVEPGIYIDGEVGVRIEDFGVVTADGFDDFTASPKDLFEL